MLQGSVSIERRSSAEPSAGPIAEPAAEPITAATVSPIAEPAAEPTTAATASPIAEAPREEARFQIFIIDTGWQSPARKVLYENFAMLSALQHGDPIYVLNRAKSLDLVRRHPSMMGKGPVIAVHDLRALREGGSGGFHGFRLHLGLLHNEQQALLALQAFVRFLATHRQAVDLEAQIRRDLRREGIIGAIEIILHHEPSVLVA